MAELVRINGEELEDDVREAGPKIPVLFLKSASPYTKGEVAGFNERIVNDLEDRRVAKRIPEAQVKKFLAEREKTAQATAEAALASALARAV